MSGDDLYLLFIFLLGGLSGGTATALWISGRNRLRRATDRLRAPDKARQEAQLKVKTARTEYAQGWRELRAALAQFLLLLLFLALCFLLVRNYLSISP
jgi:hypothetical protein